MTNLTTLTDTEYASLPAPVEVSTLAEGTRFVYADDLEDERVVTTVFEQRGTRTLVGVTREEFAPFGTSLAISATALVKIAV